MPDVEELQRRLMELGWTFSLNWQGVERGRGYWSVWIHNPGKITYVSIHQSLEQTLQDAYFHAIAEAKRFEKRRDTRDKRIAKALEDSYKS